LVGVEERAFIDARTAPSVRVASLAPVAGSGVEPLIGEFERAFIDARTAPSVRVASLAPVAGSGVEPLIGEFERAFIDGAYSDRSVVDWCDTHTPC
jgi:hypothetical protein